MLHKQICICDKAKLTTYVNIPNNKEKRPALIICPGGGYVNTSIHEGECVALQFVPKGYQCFVLDYSTLNQNPECCQYPQPLIELAKTIELVKIKSDEWYVDNDKIFLLGFSAGGNLIANYGNGYMNISKTLNIADSILKPTALILCYPALNWKTEIKNLNDYKKAIDMQQITGEKKVINVGEELAKQANQALFKTEKPSLEQMESVSPYFHINKKTPPTFIWHTVTDDMVSVEQIYEYVVALYKNNISHELHVFKRGHHGLSLANQFSSTKISNVNEQVSQWVALATTWLDTI
jgi:acetyl esterase/lipase